MSMRITFHPDAVAHSPLHEVGICSMVVEDKDVLSRMEALTMLGLSPVASIL